MTQCRHDRIVTGANFGALADEDGLFVIVPRSPIARRAVRRVALTFILVLLAQGCSAQTALYLIALMGQSNMDGELSELPAGFPANPTKIWNFTNAYKWEPAKEPIDSPQGQVDVVSIGRRGGVGPSLALADAFVSAHLGQGRAITLKDSQAKRAPGLRGLLLAVLFCFRLAFGKCLDGRFGVLLAGVRRFADHDHLFGHLLGLDPAVARVGLSHYIVVFSQLLGTCRHWQKGARRERPETKRG
jgi:hypothetical protein